MDTLLWFAGMALIGLLVLSVVVSTLVLVGSLFKSRRESHLVMDAIDREYLAEQDLEIVERRLR
jgi:hypothetical protein